ncbi:hypothetical protein Lal_00004671 [Lupinus albus]|nr:hypothetical protein Lal_00004671 [Lupinus albus]
MQIAKKKKKIGNENDGTKMNGYTYGSCAAATKLDHLNQKFLSSFFSLFVYSSQQERFLKSSESLVGRRP